MVGAVHCALAGLAVFVGYKAMQPKEKPKPEKCRFRHNVTQDWVEYPCAGNPPITDYGVKQAGNRKSVQEELKNAIAPPPPPVSMVMPQPHSGKRDDAGREK